jgi:hypothetical protein
MRFVLRPGILAPQGNKLGRLDSGAYGPIAARNSVYEYVNNWRPPTLGYLPEIDGVGYADFLCVYTHFFVKTPFTLSDIDLGYKVVGY